LSRHTIPVCRTGTLALDPADACALLARTNLLELVQQQYARQLPAGQLPEFTVQHTATNTYAYVNRHGQHSTIMEVGRLRLDNDGFAIVFYTFSEMEALVTDLCLALCEREAGRAADGSPRPSRPL
jgi:hypothetical protein